MILSPILYAFCWHTGHLPRKSNFSVCLITLDKNIPDTGLYLYLLLLTIDPNAYLRVNFRLNKRLVLFSKTRNFRARQNLVLLFSQHPNKPFTKSNADIKAKGCVFKLDEMK